MPQTLSSGQMRTDSKITNITGRFERILRGPLRLFIFFFAGLFLTSCSTNTPSTVPQPDRSLYAPGPITSADIDFADARLAAFVEGKYDPLRVPVDWYSPVRTVSGSNGVPMPRANPSPDPVMKLALHKAEAYFQEQDSLAFIVAKNGDIIFEKYWGDFERDTRFNPQSMSKTIAGLMVGLAIEDGIFFSVNDRIDQYLPELIDDPRGAITLKNLLQMSGGLEQISTSYEITPESRAVRQHFGPDSISPLMELELADPPGTKWEYNNNETLLLTYVLQRASGREYADYVSDKLWKPLGLASADMYLDRRNGTVMTSCCILSRPIDWVKIGQLILDRGAYNGLQLVPASWIDDMVTPAETSKGYGYQIWLGNRLVSPERPDTSDPNLTWSSHPYISDDLIVLSGYGFQRVWIVPSKNLVIMRAGNAWPKSWNENHVPNLLIEAAE